MTEKEASDLVGKIINDLINHQTNFNNLQTKFFEEKEKNVNLEKKNQSLENELSEIKKVCLFYLFIYLGAHPVYRNPLF